VGLGILKLAINARDAMSAGGKLTIATRNIVRGYGLSFAPLDPGHYVMGSVAGTGVGMTEDVRRRAFEPLFTTKEVHKGAGFGLSMAYGFAQQSGGTVTIDSEIGNGTTVQIYLPRAPQRGSDLEKADEESRLDAGPPSRILVVDDNSAVRTITAIMLRTFGHDAIEAAGGQEALDLLEQDKQFDLLMVDLAMPNMHGDEFAARARNLVPDVPILFLTRHPYPAWIRQRPEGEILKKPFRRVQLAGRLRYVLRVAKRRDRGRANGDKRHY